MLASVRWFNRLLTSPIAADEAAAVLIRAGFPIESSEALANGDVKLDVEVTSNRGDCLSIAGLAREIAAQSGSSRARKFVALPPQEYRKDPARADAFVEVQNAEPAVCPRFTVRVIRGVKVGPSPAWLRELLESVGQRSINNVVDVTNWANFELGQPCHAFDLRRLAAAGSGKPALIVRFARDKEELTTLDGKRRVLSKDELVVADASRAQGLAGVMGGQEAEVSKATTDIALEVATWDPVTVRRASRRHQLRTDASHRYERVVDVRTVDSSAARIAEMLAAVCGGSLCEGAVEGGGAVPALTEVRFRPARCRDILGIETPLEELVHLLGALEIHCTPLGRGGAELLCTIPPHRPDLTREIDVIEEVARLRGLEAIPTSEKLGVAVHRPQASELARREIAGILAGMGFYETVTFSFCSRKRAEMFMPSGLDVVEVDDDRRKEEPSVRPSVLTGLLSCRKSNQNAQARVEGGVRLFEVASVFAQRRAGTSGSSESVETTNIGLLLDVPAGTKAGGKATIAELQAGVRCLRGVIEAIVGATHGARAELVIEPAAPHCAGFEAGAYAIVSVSGQRLGYIGVVSRDALTEWDLAAPVVGAELSFAGLIGAYPPRVRIEPIPAFPGIDRDVSLIVGEAVTWAKVREVITGTAADRLVGAAFIGTFRGKQIGEGRKSMTVRMHFRDPARTLRHEEVDGQVAHVVATLKSSVGAELRA